VHDFEQPKCIKLAIKTSFKNKYKIYLPGSPIIYSGVFEPQDTVLVELVKDSTLSLVNSSEDELTSHIIFSSFLSEYKNQ